MRFRPFVALTGLTAATAFADTWSKEWQVSAAPEFHVESGDGRVRVTPGSGNRIEATVTTNGWKIGPGELTVTERQDGNRVQLDVRVPKQHGNMGIHQRWVQVEVHLPPGAASFIHTADGSIQINGIRGKIDVRTGDGSIEASGIDGSFAGHTGDGHVHLQGRLDRVDIETGDGSIEVYLAEASKLMSGWRMHTGDGHITIQVPKTLSAHLDAHTSDGSITVDPPITLESDANDHHEMRATLNGGGEMLTISTGDGSIHITGS